MAGQHAVKTMTLTEFKKAVSQLSFGKRLPGATYIFQDWFDPTPLGSDSLEKLVANLRGQFELGPEFNVLKFRTVELKVSFLSYPAFMDDPHPSLNCSVTIDIVTNQIRRTVYSGNSNPPILHRKELFLPANHPHRAVFEALTQAEELAGLFEETSTIGFKLNWEQVLMSKGVEVVEHELRPKLGASEYNRPLLPVVDRYKTALTRYDLSRPVKTLLEFGMLQVGRSVFDYGCGLGADIRGLTAMGYEVAGWDPVHRPEGQKKVADIVNLGFVLNVIEDPAERVEALVTAYGYARRLLVVAALVSKTVEIAKATSFGDGVLTKRNTFQKFFEQQELHQYIEDVLDCPAVPVALGVFYVFRNSSDHQDFLVARNRRPIDWNQVSSRLGLGGPRTLWNSLYAQHRDLLDRFGSLTIQLGRIPTTDEFSEMAELECRLGNAKRALRAYVEGGRPQGLDWKTIQGQFGIGQTPKRQWELLYEKNRGLLDEFWGVTLELGRLPEAPEFSRLTELREQIGTPKQALRLLVQKGGAGEVKQAAETRKSDLLVYVALANLRKRVPFGHLSLSLQTDIRTFFGNYTHALEKGLELLYAAGDPGEIEIACEGLKLGWQDGQALYFHRSLLAELPPVLRAYVGCAAALFGDVSQADVVKLHKTTRKATFLVYDDFDGNPLPMLRQRIKVNLRNRWVEVFDHSADKQLLFYKERLISGSDPRQERLQSFSTKFRKLGVPETFGTRPIGQDFLQMLKAAGLSQNLNPCGTIDSAP
jgi:hypothetical protein